MSAPPSGTSAPPRRPVRGELRGRAAPLPSRTAVVGIVLALAGLVVGFQFGRSSAPASIVGSPPPSDGPGRGSSPLPSGLVFSAGPSPAASGPGTRPNALVQPANVAPDLVEAYLDAAATGWAICVGGPPVRCKPVQEQPISMDQAMALDPATWAAILPAIIEAASLGEGPLVAVVQDCGLVLDLRVVYLAAGGEDYDVEPVARAATNGCVEYLDLDGLSLGRYAIIGTGIMTAFGGGGSPGGSTGSVGPGGASGPAGAGGASGPAGAGEPQGPSRTAAPALSRVAFAAAFSLIDGVP